MLPLLGQGAANALEDAMILARCLVAESTPERAFERYESTRQPRVRAAEKAAGRSDRCLGEPGADGLKGNESGPAQACDAVTGPLA